MNEAIFQQDAASVYYSRDVRSSLTLCRSNTPIGILSIELHAVLDGKVKTLPSNTAVLDGKVKTLPSNTACSSMESIPIGLLDRQRVKDERTSLE